MTTHHRDPQHCHLCGATAPAHVHDPAHSDDLHAVCHACNNLKNDLDTVYLLSLALVFLYVVVIFA